MWSVTEDIEQFAERVWDLLAADPQANSVPLTLIESIRSGFKFSDLAPVFGWYADGAGIVTGAVLMTPPYPLLLCAIPGGTVPALVESLRLCGAPVAGVNGVDAEAYEFARSWVAGSQLTIEEYQRVRLYVLGELGAPAGVGGSARQATDDDVELADGWVTAFSVEATGGGEPPGDGWAQDRIDTGTLVLWQVDGEVVAMAARREPAAGVARIGPVYTPPEHRNRGYGSAVTAACTRAALDAGAQAVVLFTDLANPVSNSIYQAIGYRPVSDRVMLRFVPSADAVVVKTDG